MHFQMGESRKLAQIEKRSLQILGVLVLGSLIWRSWPVSLGLILGGAVALLNFRWLWYIMKKVLLEKKGMHGFQALLKFTALLFTFYLIFRFTGIHPVAFVVGISVLFMSILSETLGESLRHARRGNP